MILAILLSATLLSDGELCIEGEKKIDPARATVVKVSPRGIDLRERFRGFSVADDYEDEKENCTWWQLIPGPCEENYRIAPFAFKGRVVGPVYFENPDLREPVTGAMEVEVTKDMPPLSWRLVGRLLSGLVLLFGFGVGIYFGVRYFMRRVHEHRMSPVERAWAELDRLLKKGLPGRGRYKDFYVELTLVVRRYVQRQHGVKAPHMTTEEFFEATRASSSFPKAALDELIDFLRKADMIKFAGIEATPDTADEATVSAKQYIAKDDEIVKRRSQK